jgi:tripartite-type tricarboxylate transporter receptor subunit TctC
LWIEILLGGEREMKKLFLVGLAVVLFSALCIGCAKKAKFPSRPLTLIVPTGAGGGSDTVGRKIASLVEKKIGQPINVNNVVGGGGVVGWERVKASPKDGYILMLSFGELNTIPHATDVTVRYDDFQPLILLNKSPSVLTVRSDSPWHTIEEFLADAKKEPGKIRIGTAGPTSVWSLGASAIEKECGVQFTLVPAETNAVSQSALLGGHIEALTVSDGEVTQYVRAGEMRIIGVLDDRRLDSYPNVPTFAESGYPGVASFTWRGISLPKGCPQEVIDYLYPIFKECAESQEFKEFMTTMNYPMLVLGPDEFQKAIDEWDVHFKNLLVALGWSK